MKKVAFSGILLSTFLFLLVESCFLFSSQAAAADTAPLRIVIIPKIIGIQYYDAVKRGVDSADEELPGVTVEWIGPTIDSSEKQIEIIEQAISQKPDLIAVAANNSHAIDSALQKAAAAGIRIMSWDGDTESREFFVNLVDYHTFGEKLAESMHRQVGDTADIAVIITNFTASNQVQWLKAVKRTIYKRYPGLSILDIRPATESRERAFRITQDYLATFPTLKGILVLGTPNLPGTAEAVKQAGLSKKIAIVGNTTPNAIRPYLKEGVVEEVFLWNAPDHGYLTVYCAWRLLADGITPGVPFDAGRLGMVTPVKDDISMQVSLPTKVFTANNVDQYDF
jgi:ABC-type sugar transport system substrate-binding protein